MIDRLLTQPCTITRSAPTGPPDVYGNPTEQTTTADALCYCEQRTGREDTAGRDLQAEDWLIVLPAGTGIDGGDRVTVDSLGTFEILGPPWPAHNPRTGTTSHVECRARRTT